MISRGMYSTAITTCLLFAASATQAPAQITNGGTASENVRATGARSPGHMVSAGLGRAQTAVRDPFAQPQITELPPLIGGFNSIFVPQAIEVLAGQINDFFEFIFGLLLRRSGWPPLDATNTSTGSGADTTNDTSGDTGTRPGRGAR